MSEAINYDDEPTTAVGPDADSLVHLAELAGTQLELEREVEAAEAALKDLKEKLRNVSEKQIPDLLDGTGLSEVRLADGTKVIVKEDIQVSTTGKWRVAINNWLTSTGHGDLIKDELKVACGRDQEAAVEALVNLAQEHRFSVDRNRFVNPQSLKAFLRERLEAGEDVPLDELGAHVFRKTKLEAPRR